MNKKVLYTLVLLILVACGTSHKARQKPMSVSYKKDATVLHPQFAVFNVSDSITELHFRIASRELLYTRPDGLNFSSNVLISYRLLPSYDSKLFTDSASVRIVDNNNKLEDKYLIGKMNVKAKAFHSYFLKITVTDLNRNIMNTTVVILDKLNDLNRENFMVKDKKTDAPLFSNYTGTGEELTIQYKAKIGVTLYARYYNRDFPLALPPFVTSDPSPFKYKADSTFTLQLSADGTVDFTSRKKGFYHFQLDTTKHEGLTIFNFSETFPEVKKVEDMMAPLKFITSNTEYQDLTLSTNKKGAVEKLWITFTGNEDKAREGIHKFYTRVKDANLYYSSYLEGWKTDRGMIYLVFGAPTTIYRTANSETWTYGEENNINSLQYTFIKVNNPFTDNDYTLERSPIYKQSYYSAVDVWRQGKFNTQD